VCTTGKINYYEIAMKRAQEEDRGTPAKAEASTPAAASAQAQARPDNASGKVNFYEIAMKRAAQEERASLDRPSQVLYVCLICMSDMYVFYVFLTCMPNMHVSLWSRLAGDLLTVLV